MNLDWEKIGARAYLVVAVVAAIGVPATLAYMGLGKIGLLAALPIVAWFASRLIVHGGAGALTWFSRQPYQAWQGAYYAYNDVQVRVYEEEGRLWFVAADVLKAVSMRALPDAFRAAHPRALRKVSGTRLTALDAAGIEQLLARRTDREATGFLLWMRREVLGPWERKQGR